MVFGMHFRFKLTALQSLLLVKKAWQRPLQGHVQCTPILHLDNRTDGAVHPVHKSEDVTSQTDLQLGSQSIGQASSSHRIQSQTTKLR